MQATTVTHDTIRLRHSYTASPALVFAAYADPVARSVWSVPSDDEVLIYSRAEFAPGGTDHFVCGPKSAPSFAGTTTYEVIERDALIVSRENIWDGDQLLSLSIITWALTPTSDGTTLAVTDQITSLCGTSMVDGSRVGRTAALANLEAWLEEDTT